MNTKHGFVRVGTVSPTVHIGNVAKNKEEIIKCINKAVLKGVDILLFPELCITGYTCADLFGQKKLIDEALQATIDIIEEVYNMVVVVGLPVIHNDIMYNTAAVLTDLQIAGIVPKQYIPNYGEFYECRWFDSGKDINDFIEINNKSIPFGNILFNVAFRNFDQKSNSYHTASKLKFGIEICEDLWTPIPPSSFQTLNGAQIILNPSASNETAGKMEYRNELVKNQSARCIAAYVYASSGMSESTTDVVFSAHNIIAENGEIKKYSIFKENHIICTDVDYQKLTRDRTLNKTFSQQVSRFKDNKLIETQINLTDVSDVSQHDIAKVDPSSFMPDNSDFYQRCKTISNIQVYGLTQRIKNSGSQHVHIGVSGGLDSTLALLTTKAAFYKLGIDPKNIHGYSLPGFGTSERTKSNASKLMEACGVSHEIIDIKQACFDMFKSLNHKPFGIDAENVEDLQEKLLHLNKDDINDLVFENVQARVRTLILMSKGFVIGTGDLSELALGWCTYNADHMSMYNTNASVPKTLIKYLIDWYQEVRCDKIDFSINQSINIDLQDVLRDILNTEISPELLPIHSGKIQSTEDTIGPYKVNDFFLYHFLRNGFSPEKILFLAKNAFKNDQEVCKNMDDKDLENTLKQLLYNFYKRFFRAQFKRSCVPDGPKVGSVSLSPRGDWRMPSDADPSMWMEACDAS